MAFDWKYYENKYKKRIYPKGVGLLLKLPIKSCLDGRFIYYSKVKEAFKNNLNQWNNINFKSKKYLYRTNWNKYDFDINLLRSFNKQEYKK